MARSIVFLHTVLSVVGLFGDLAREMLPSDVQIHHLADEMLARIVVAEGGLTPLIYRRVAQHVMGAEQAGAQAIQFTCSSISPCADVSRSLVSIPVLRIDEPMVDRALSIGSRVGVAATAATALRPVAELVRTRAASRGQTVEVEAMLCEGAYEALFSGHAQAHDQIVACALRDLAVRNNVVLLAQASMERATRSMGSEECPVPILTSSRLAVERLLAVLDAQAS
jgi:Asp/Glu/hydantoin racemase